MHTLNEDALIPLSVCVTLALTTSSTTPRSRCAGAVWQIESCAVNVHYCYCCLSSLQRPCHAPCLGDRIPRRRRINLRQANPTQKRHRTAHSYMQHTHICKSIINELQHNLLVCFLQATMLIQPRAHPVVSVASTIKILQYVPTSILSRKSHIERWRVQKAVQAPELSPQRSRPFT